MARRKCASAEEILRYLSSVMRGEEENAGTAPMKAAELLGRRMGLFAEQGEELPPPVIVDDLGGSLPGG